MKTPNRINNKPLLARVGSLILILSGVLIVTPSGCLQGAEGDRCNPDLAAGESDCNAGLSCQTPLYCPESYCCPTTGTSTNPFCQVGCNGGQASICDAGGDADCTSLGSGGSSTTSSSGGTGGGDAGDGG